MIISIPYQHFNVQHIQMAPFLVDKYNRCIAALTYKDPCIEFKDITLLSPAMKVLYYNTKTCRLQLDLSDHIAFQLKIYKLYEYLTHLLSVHHEYLSYENIRHFFYNIIDKSVLSLYIHPNTIVKTRDNVGVPISSLEHGQFIKCIIRIQGISQVCVRNENRLRLHHSVPSLWLAL